MGSNLPVFTQEEMAVDEAQGFPKAYALLCRSSQAMSPLAHGPPLTFIPYDFQSQEASREKELGQMFPIIDPDARPSSNPLSYVNFLWEKLDHLGNAGFDPELFRVDAFGNVLYLHADSASPLAWSIDHWFPCSRGGKSVPSNLRILQWQVCRKKKNKLDLLIPWWDLQLGISVNQFLTIFASRNSDFRSRAFSFLFQDDGEDENIPSPSKSHVFPQKFLDAKKKLGLAPAAIVSRKSSSEAMVLKAIDFNRSSRHNSTFPVKSLHKEVDGAGNAFQTFKSGGTKEDNHQPLDDDFENNPYLAISSARDSLRQRKEMKKQEAEINRLDEELNELKKKNDTGRTGLQELEATLIKRRKRVERCRRLSEAQASYRTLLEKMIRDAMHQTTVYKEQLRLNQAASSTLMARLEAHRASCDSTENDLRRKYKQRDEMEIQAMSFSEQARKRLRIYDDLHEDNSSLLSTKRRVRRHTKKELREFLEAEQKASEAGISLSFEEEDEEELEEEDEDETESIINEKEGKGIGESSANEINDKVCRNNNQKKQIYSVEEGNGTILASKDQELITNNKLKQIQHTELNNLNRNASCKRNSDQMKQTSYPCSSSNSVEVANNKLKQIQHTELKNLNKNASCKRNSDQMRQTSYPCSSSNSVEVVNADILKGQEQKEEENEETLNLVGKGNVDKWLQMLLENAKSTGSPPSPKNNCSKSSNIRNEIMQKETNLMKINHPSKENHQPPNLGAEIRFKGRSRSQNSSEMSRVEAARVLKGAGGSRNSEIRDDLPKFESSRGFNSFPSSPSVILRARRSLDCLRRKPTTISNIVASSISRTMKK